MKTVGILTRMDFHNGKEIHYVVSDLLYKLHRKVKIKIIYFTKDDILRDIIEDVKECDGIILPGGDNLYTLEIALCQYLHQNNVPTLGICLGMQTMAIAFNGEFSSKEILNHKTKEINAHSIIVDSKSRLCSIVKNTELLVNSRHKDHIKTTDLNIAAFSCDHIIEAVEDPNKKFFIGVQWHPENLNDIATNRLFSYFINVL